MSQDQYKKAIARRAAIEGSKAATQADLRAQADAVATFQRYQAAKAANPIAAAALRATHGAAIDLGYQLSQAAEADRPAIAQLSTAESAAGQIIDRQTFQRYQQAKARNPFAAAQFRADNAEAIERGSHVASPEPPDDPPPQAA